MNVSRCAFLWGTPADSISNYSGKLETYLIVVVGARPPQHHRWVLVRVAHDDVEAVATEVELGEVLLLMHEQRVVQGAHGATLKAEHCRRHAPHLVILFQLPGTHLKSVEGLRGIRGSGPLHCAALVNA